MKKLSLKGTSADAILLTCIKLVTAVLGLAITRLLSEYLSVHEYGTYSQILLVVSTVSSITIFGMMDGMNYFYCREKDVERREAYISTIWALQFVLSTLAATAVLLLTQPLCRYFDNPNIKRLIVFAAFLPLAQNLLWILQVLIVSVGKARTLAIRNLVISILRFVSVLGVVFFIRSAAVVIAATLILDLGQIIFFLAVLKKNKCYIKLCKADLHLLGEILRYCAPMAIFIIVNSLNRDMDKYLISMMTNTETLALYANASKQLPFDILMASFGTVLVPHITRFFAEKAYSEAVKTYKAFLELAYISAGILCFAALASAPQLMKLLYSNKYTDGIAIFCIYILADLFRVTTNITIALTTAGKTKQLMILGFATLSANALLNVLMYKAMGIIGPALATLIVTITSGAVILYLDAKVFKAKLSLLFDIKKLTIFITEGIVLTITLNMLGHFLDSMDLHYFLILIIVAGTFGITMLVFNGKRLFEDMKILNRLSHHNEG